MTRLLQVKLLPCPTINLKLKILPVVTSCWMPLTEIRAFFIGLPNLSDTIPFIPRWTWRSKVKLDGSNLLQYNVLIFYKETPAERKQFSRGSTHYKGCQVLMPLQIASSILGAQGGGRKGVIEQALFWAKYVALHWEILLCTGHCRLMICPQYLKTVLECPL